MQSQRVAIAILGNSHYEKTKKMILPLAKQAKTKKMILPLAKQAKNKKNDSANNDSASCEASKKQKKYSALNDFV